MLLLTAKAGVLEPATTHARQDAVPPALGHVTDVEEPVQEPALGAKVAAMAAMAVTAVTEIVRVAVEGVTEPAPGTVMEGAKVAARQGVPDALDAEMDAHRPANQTGVLDAAQDAEAGALEGVLAVAEHSAGTLGNMEVLACSNICSTSR